MLSAAKEPLLFPGVPDGAPRPPTMSCVVRLKIHISRASGSPRDPQDLAQHFH